MNSVHNSNTFLAYFNQIDKYLSYVLGLHKYVPYHERITMIVRGNYPVSTFVKQVELKLRYFGDMRNQLVHGFRLENKHYLLVSDHAIQQISTIHDELIKPKTLAEIKQEKTFSVLDSTPLTGVLTLMNEQQLKYMPVYKAGPQQVQHESQGEENNIFIGVLSLQEVTDRLVKQETITVQEIMLQDLATDVYIEHIFTTDDKSIYELQSYFANESHTEVVLANKTGKESEKITSMISIYDFFQLQRDFGQAVY